MSDAQTTSWHLIAAAAGGDDTARAEFARRYGDDVRGLLRQRWKSGLLLQHIDDACQEVFVECLKPGGVLVRADPAVAAGFRGLLGAVVRNVALRVERRLAQWHRRAAAPLPTDPPGSHTSLAHALDRNWALGLVREAAEEQERRAQTSGPQALLRVKLLRARVHDGQGIAALAAQWGVAAAYLHHQFAKARRDFLRALHGVLERRFPSDSRLQQRERARQLIQLLRDT